MTVRDRPIHIAIIVHYFPPINSSGAKRFEAMSKYFARRGYKVSVITTSKTGADGAFTEAIPVGVALYELDGLGRLKASQQGDVKFEAMYADKPSMMRRLKTIIMDWFGQVPDPRLPFSLSFAGPMLARDVRTNLKDVDVVIGSCPPWPMILAALFAARRFDAKCIMDYRDPFSDCHEMPGGRFAKMMERIIDRHLVKKADHVVAISKPIAEYYAQFNPRTTVIMNGYDHEVVDQAMAFGGWKREGRGSPIIIRYMGLVSPGRVPHNLLRALARAQEQRPELHDRLRFEYYGPTDVMEKALDELYPNIRGFFSFHQSVPYQKSLQLSLESDYLLFCETSSTDNPSARGILTTKLFEYIATGRPIIAEIDRETLAGGLIVSADADHTVSTSQKDFEQLLLSEEFLVPRESKQSPIATKLSREYAANQYAELIESMVGAPPSLRAKAA